MSLHPKKVTLTQDALIFLAKRVEAYYLSGLSFEQAMMRALFR